MLSNLAIVVPAYKTRFLDRTLASIAGQTSDEARVYVFDDAGPREIEEIARKYMDGRGDRWSYHRFDQNMGGSELIRHYDRCVKFTAEPWIWLFSDDDVMEDDCVASFARAIGETAALQDVYCFDSVEIDAEDQVTALHPTLADREDWKEYAYFLFRGHRMAPQQAMIFSRKAYERLGGFIEFPVGWASDQASLMGMAKETGMRRIEGARVRFRQSGENISSIEDRALSSRKLKAAMLFLRWVFSRLDENRHVNARLDDELVREAGLAWLKRHLVALHTWYKPAECMEVARFIRETSAEPYAKALLRMARLNVGYIYYQAVLASGRGRKSKAAGEYGNAVSKPGGR